MPENLYPTVSAHRDVKRTFAIRFRYLLMNAVALRPAFILYIYQSYLKFIFAELFSEDESAYAFLLYTNNCIFQSVFFLFREIDDDLTIS